jgi:hypothetical protein
MDIFLESTDYSNKSSSIHDNYSVKFREISRCEELYDNFKDQIIRKSVKLNSSGKDMLYFCGIQLLGESTVKRVKVEDLKTRLVNLDEVHREKISVEVMSTKHFKGFPQVLLEIVPPYINVVIRKRMKAFIDQK